MVNKGAVHTLKLIVCEIRFRIHLKFPKGLPSLHIEKTSIPLPPFQQ